MFGIRGSGVQGLMLHNSFDDPGLKDKILHLVSQDLGGNGW